jgi:hypothetical protein
MPRACALLHQEFEAQSSDSPGLSFQKHRLLGVYALLYLTAGVIVS